MKKIILFILLITAKVIVFAQDDFSTPGAYLDYIGKQQDNISKKYLAYSSAASHGKRAKKVENLRDKLLDEVQESRMNISGMLGYKGDKEYRDSSVSFMKLYYNVLNDDYAKIINLEDVAEQSYDEMEAYLMVEELIDKKLDDANSNIRDAQKKFADKYHINLVAATDDISEKMRQTGKVNKYYKPVYLTFFKSYKEEEYVWDAIDKKNVTAIEQNKNALIQYAQEGLKSLDTIKAFEGDNSLVIACKSLLKFYISETDKLSVVSDYLLVQERFNKMKADYDAKSDHSKDDVNNYNKGVKEINDASNKYNQTSSQIYQGRKELIDNWNNAVKSFFDDHMPKYK
ncbi:LIC11966 family surface protein [Ferruginibacter albus]|uniref:LIC11966 family surface protein n=1 Tax=Ferruginibacter albus TaxID=2875540 RepID=UPI001CC6A3FB|nr:hypothetical protein [Ferruginibacter albus]UAY53418.1 hypothetical protein K9M53_07030 [Ferruginibacter albus]